MKAAALGLLAACLVVTLLGAGFFGGRWTAPAPPHVVPPYQQVTYSGAGLLQTLTYENVPVADLTFLSVEPVGRGYRVRWLVTEGDNSAGTWQVTTTGHGTITSIRLLHRSTAGAS